MERVLVIDDVRTLGTIPEKDHARTSHAAISTLQAFKEFDAVYVDYDLGEFDTIDPVLKYIERRHHSGNPIHIKKVYVHSANPPGAEKIVRTLSRFYPTERLFLEK